MSPISMEMSPIDDKTWMTFGNILPDQKLSCKADISFSTRPQSHTISSPLQVLLKSIATRVHLQFIIIFLVIFSDSF